LGADRGGVGPLCRACRRSKAPLERPRRADRLLLYGLALIAFGLSHFFYLELTAPLVPSWLPGPVFWAYATGTIYTVCGLAIATNFAPRLGALGAAANITLITVLVWVPIVAAGGLTACTGRKQSCPAL
jgi:uncharacterized membrane protein